ncbi:hypothetical protein Tco_1369252 [Tanacetum coccineum]
MSNRHQELASPEQMASGKDFSNPLIADTLLKTIWFSTHHASQANGYCCVASLLRCCNEKLKNFKISKSSSSSKKGLKNRRLLGFRSLYNLLLLVVVSTVIEDLVLLIKIVENRLMVSPPIVTSSNVVTPTVEKTNDGFQTAGKKKKTKGKSKSTNGEEDDKEDVENVHDESSNLIQSTKAGGSSSFTAAADTPLVSPFLDSDDHSDDGKVLNELEEYGNAGQLCCQRAYNNIMVEGLKSIGKNLVAIVRDVYVFVGSFTYIMNFVVLEDIREFILRDMAEVVMEKPFRKITKLEYDCAKLYLMRRSLEVLRKFHMTILEGRFNQLSHVSSPLLSKPWEY